MTSVDGLRMDYILLNDEICFSYIGTDEWRNKCKKLIIAVKTFAILVQCSNPWHWVRTGRGVGSHFFSRCRIPEGADRGGWGWGGGGRSDETIVETHLLKKKNLQESLFFLPKFCVQQVNEQWVINERALLQLKSILSLISIWEDSDRDQPFWIPFKDEELYYICLKVTRDVSISLHVISVACSRLVCIRGRDELFS